MNGKVALQKDGRASVEQHLELYVDDLLSLAASSVEDKTDESKDDAKGERNEQADETGATAEGGVGEAKGEDDGTGQEVRPAEVAVQVRL